MLNCSSSCLMFRAPQKDLWLCLMCTKRDARLTGSPQSMTEASQLNIMPLKRWMRILADGYLAEKRIIARLLSTIWNLVISTSSEWQPLTVKEKVLHWRLNTPLWLRIRSTSPASLEPLKLRIGMLIASTLSGLLRLTMAVHQSQRMLSKSDQRVANGPGPPRFLEMLAQHLYLTWMKIQTTNSEYVLLMRLDLESQAMLADPS